MLDWEKLTQPDFDRTVELLIKRWYEHNHPELTVQAIDGRGGDGGVDLDVHETATDRLVKIYQLKFFPEGFSGGHSYRRKQIQNSFEKAAKLVPPVWALVIPRNFTTHEREWVKKLIRDSGIRVEFVGRAELDNFQASDPDAISLAERTSDRKALATVGREHAALMNSCDLASEVARLKSRADARSAHWGIDVATQGDTIIQTIFAKHPDAATREPLSISFGLDFTEHPQLRAEYETAISYGVIDHVTLPPEVVQSFERIGPEWFSGRSDASELKLRPLQSGKVDLPAVLRVSSATAPTRTLRGITSWITRGTEGAQVQTVFGGGLTITWRLAEDRAIGSTGIVTFAPQGQPGTDVDRSIRLLEMLYEGAEMLLEVDGHKQSLAVAPQSGSGISLEVAELANDLVVIEHLTGTQFSFPDSMETVNRIWVRVVRRLLEGDCVIAPGMESANLVLSGTLDEGLEKLLNGPTTIMATTPTWSAVVCGEEVLVGDIRYYHPSVRVVDAAEHLAALRAGTAAGREARLVPDDPKQGFRVYSPSRFKHGTVVPVPWGLRGIHEHPEIANRPE